MYPVQIAVPDLKGSISSTVWSIAYCAIMTSTVSSCQSFQVTICDTDESCSGVAMYSGGFTDGDTGNANVGTCSDGIIEEIT